ncbi:MAG: hypothetical protein EA347_05160 [Thioalkalivibrio sp.]|nr:MAG: hypothetical protein EA347_05160 [Thioalkalivibrio sp.]
MYELSYTPGQDALSTLDVFSGADSLRPGFRNDVQRGRELNIEVRSMRMPSVSSPGGADRALETRGGFIQHFGSTGFGYGFDVGLGLGSSGDAEAWFPDDAFSGSSRFVVTDFSTGPTYQTGNLHSRVRVGLRHPLVGEPDAVSAFHGHRGDTSRSAGYLSLDSRLRFSNQTEMSLSLFYDDYGFGSSRDWLSDRLDFQGGEGSPDSVIGFEMGLNF